MAFNDHTFTAPDGTELAYRRTGGGPPVVITHGILSVAADWERVAHRLARSNTVHVMNRRGRPGSGELGPGYGLVTEINDLHALLDHTGPDTALVGPSYGALTSSWPSTGQDPHPRCGWGR